MKKKNTTDSSMEWMAFEEVEEFIACVCRRLRDGGEGAGATLTLTPDECLKLSMHVIPPTRPASREPKYDYAQIKLYCMQLQRGLAKMKEEDPFTKMSPSDAVAQTAKYFKCSKWIVNDACRTRAVAK